MPAIVNFAPSSAPRSALDALAALTTSLSRINTWDRMLEQMRNSYAPQAPAESAREYCRSAAVALHSADVYHVADHMVPIIEQSAIDLTDCTWRQQVFPSTLGFAYFSSAVQLTEDGVKLHAVSWSTEYDHLLITGYTIDPELVLFPHIEIDLVIGRPVAYSVSTAEMALEKVAYALLLLLQQRVVHVSERKIVYRAHRKSKKTTSTSVRVVRLRRYNADQPRASAEHSQVEWSCRWTVRGHWAWRSCASDHPLAEPYEKGWRVQTYVAPYIKNAEREDLPFIQRPVVSTLVR